jgi:hypothetical protein
VSRAALGAAVMPEGWTPSYEAWRHGGWYVTNVRYPSGAVGCVSRNYSDRKWRIVCMGTGPGVEGDETYPNRDAAARAELGLVAELAYQAGVFDTSRLWLGRRTPKTAVQRASALAGITQCNADWDANRLTTSDDMIRLGWDPCQRAGYELRWHEVTTTLARFDADAGLARFRSLDEKEIRRRQGICHEQIGRAHAAGNTRALEDLRRMDDALMAAMTERTRAGASS